MPSISGVIMWDHPRLRGEQVAARQISCIFQGSPPLARGTGAGSVYVRNLPGITPACAGNRHSAISSSKALKDHPRLRGEQLPQHGLCRHVNGSPPLARGTAVPSYFRQARAGITPACAGNSRPRSFPPHHCGDHPRLRGEQSVLTRGKTPRVGSPPLARGTVRSYAGQNAPRGITPACAGNSLQNKPPACAGGDHPRLRGEQAHRGQSLSRHRGSPPLARGTVPQYQCSRISGRITPACAGNS